jgi:eukaryotic-like serine/threonine-protein kinase
MSDISNAINGYRLLRDFSTAGGGMCRWTFASKNGKDYFLKEFLTPKFPVDGSPGSVKTIQRRLSACRQFEAYQMRLAEAIKPVTSSGGNLVAPVEFFRSGSLYYKVTEKVDVTTLSPAEISLLPLDKKLLLLKTITHSLGLLHRLGIVHGDLKPENILIKKKGDSEFVAKLIDMDNSYFSGETPAISDESDVVGTPNYYSPELGLYIKNRIESDSEKLTVASDIFALGIIFCQYITGNPPAFSPRCSYVWEAVCDGLPLSISSPLMPNSLRLIIENMLVRSYIRRPTSTSIFNALKLLNGTDTVPAPGVSRLKGTMFSK